MKKGLGKGLGAIMGINTRTVPVQNSENQKQPEDKGKKDPASALPESGNVSYETNQETKITDASGAAGIRISLIDLRSDQPRKQIDDMALSELADSIKIHGILQPILVRKKGTRYEIIAGERRFRAAKLAGLREIPALVKEFDDQETAETSLIENIQREDLNSVEEARAYKTLINEFHLTQEELAGRVSKSRTAITNSLRILNLDDEILNMLEDEKIQAGHARAILAINGEGNRLEAAREIADRNLSVRAAEKLAKKYNLEKSKEKSKQELVTEKNPGGNEYSIYLKDLSNRLTEAMNTKVSIKPTGKHKGHINIEYYSEEELDDLAQRLL